MSGAAHVPVSSHLCPFPAQTTHLVRHSRSPDALAVEWRPDGAIETSPWPDAICDLVMSYLPDDVKGR